MKQRETRKLTIYWVTIFRKSLFLLQTVLQQHAQHTHTISIGRHALLYLVPCISVYRIKLTRAKLRVSLIVSNLSSI